jgi:uncharacterized protein YabN with tetrapyrrole methylase and pyrophosphatase domain
MIRRHPHLFGGGERQDWEALKARERPEGASVLSGLASGLDPLLKAYRIQDRVAGVGFDWPDASGALAKVREELDEVGEALDAGDADALLEEIGDLLFSAVNLARLAGVHPDAASWRVWPETGGSRSPERTWRPSTPSGRSSRPRASRVLGPAPPRAPRRTAPVR